MAATKILTIQSDTDDTINTQECCKDTTADDAICKSYISIINQINTTSSGFRKGRKWKCTHHSASCKNLSKNVPKAKDDRDSGKEDRETIYHKQAINSRSEQETKIKFHEETAYLLRPLHMLPQLGEHRVNDIQIKISPAIPHFAEDPPRKFKWDRSGHSLIASRKVESTPSNLSSSRAFNAPHTPLLSGTATLVRGDACSLVDIPTYLGSTVELGDLTSAMSMIIPLTSMASIPVMPSIRTKRRPRLQIDLTRKKPKGKKTQWTVLCVAVSLLIMSITMVCSMLSFTTDYQNRTIVNRIRFNSNNVNYSILMDIEDGHSLDLLLDGPETTLVENKFKVPATNPAPERSITDDVVLKRRKRR